VTHVYCLEGLRRLNNLIRPNYLIIKDLKRRTFELKKINRVGVPGIIITDVMYFLKRSYRLTMGYFDDFDNGF
jgi:hypothetical protein